MYESEHTRFIKELIKEDPELPRKQQEGRQIWWDKVLDADLYKGFYAGKLPQGSYVYNPLPTNEEPK